METTMCLGENRLFCRHSLIFLYIGGEEEMGGEKRTVTEAQYLRFI